MQHISTTPFGRRPVTAGLLAARARAGADTLVSDAPEAEAVSKWRILRDLGLARQAFGVTDRDLSVLSALVSFLREDGIAATGAIVFPSNAVLCARAHGMAESTLRRHLAALVRAGLILRHDSPNGKRYAVRGMGEGLDRAFGLDLAPLAHRAGEIAEAARQAALATERLRRLRETVVLRLRDCEKLVAFAMEEGLPAGPSGAWQALADAVALTRRMLRRKMDLAALQGLDGQVTELLERINQSLTLPKTEEMRGNDDGNGRHKRYSTITSIDLEPCKENARAAAGVEGSEAMDDPAPQLPLHLILRACPEIETYATGGIRGWRDLVAAAAFVRGMIGVSPDAWEEACFHMGPEVAAIAVACILQSFDRIGSPGGYLRALSRKAQAGAFSPGPMVMALLRAETARAA